MELPKDIIKRIHQDFEGNEREYVLKALHKKRFSESKDSWSDPIIRTVLFVSKGDLKKLQFDLDSKDTIARYMASYGYTWKSAKYNHHFNMTFDEMEELNSVLQNDLKEEFNERENLPFDFFGGDEYYVKVSEK